MSPSNFKRKITERFERGSPAIAALNHSNICQLYDVGELSCDGADDGVPIEGPVPPDQALRHAKQIAYALEAAHGIIHRDLKPATS